MVYVHLLPLVLCSHCVPPGGHYLFVHGLKLNGDLVMVIPVVKETRFVLWGMASLGNVILTGQGVPVCGGLLL